MSSKLYLYSLFFNFIFNPEFLSSLENPNGIPDGIHGDDLHGHMQHSMEDIHHPHSHIINGQITRNIWVGSGGTATLCTCYCDLPSSDPTYSPSRITTEPTAYPTNYPSVATIPPDDTVPQTVGKENDSEPMEEESGKESVAATNEEPAATTDEELVTTTDEHSTMFPSTSDPDVNAGLADPTFFPSKYVPPTERPVASPSTYPTSIPSVKSSLSPTYFPSLRIPPSGSPTVLFSEAPTILPSDKPVPSPTYYPSLRIPPSATPTTIPSISQTLSPTGRKCAPSA